MPLPLPVTVTVTVTGYMKGFSRVVQLQAAN
jgi:hypothetical protein